MVASIGVNALKSFETLRGAIHSSTHKKQGVMALAVVLQYAPIYLNFCLINNQKFPKNSRFSKQSILFQSKLDKLLSGCRLEKTKLSEEDLIEALLWDDNDEPWILDLLGALQAGAVLIWALQYQAGKNILVLDTMLDFVHFLNERMYLSEDVLPILFENEQLPLHQNLRPYFGIYFDYVHSLISDKELLSKATSNHFGNISITNL